MVIIVMLLSLGLMFLGCGDGGSGGNSGFNSGRGITTAGQFQAFLEDNGDYRIEFPNIADMFKPELDVPQDDVSIIYKITEDKLYCTEISSSVFSRKSGNKSGVYPFEGTWEFTDAYSNLWEIILSGTYVGQMEWEGEMHPALYGNFSISKN